MLTTPNPVRSLAELVSPLSRGKVYLLFELLDANACDDFKNCFLIAQALDINLAAPDNLVDKLACSSYLTVEGGLNEPNITKAQQTVAVFNQKQFNGLLRAYLFIDGNLTSYS